MISRIARETKTNIPWGTSNWPGIIILLGTSSANDYGLESIVYRIKTNAGAAITANDIENCQRAVQTFFVELQTDQG